MNPASSWPRRCAVLWALLALLALFVPVSPTFAQAPPPEASFRVPLAKSPLEPVPSLLEALRSVQSVDFCGEPVPLDRPEVRERFEREFLFKLWDRPQTLLWIKRSGRFFPPVEKAITEAGLCPDLKYIAVVESSLLPEAGSPKGAIGLWQFMPATGAAYGLTAGENRDERKDPARSGPAAVKLLGDLHRSLKSWSLAAAAYNAGEGRVREAMTTQNRTDFHDLWLPQETMNYLMKIVVAKTILNDPARFGHDIRPDDLYRPWPAETVELNLAAPVPLVRIALAANTSYRRIREYNPDLAGRTLDKGPQRLNLPPGGREALLAAWPALAKEFPPKPTFVRRTVGRGETVQSIAAGAGIGVEELMRINHWKKNRRVKPGMTILVPER